MATGRPRPRRVTAVGALAVAAIAAVVAIGCSSGEAADGDLEDTSTVPEGAQGRDADDGTAPAGTGAAAAGADADTDAAPGADTGASTHPDTGADPGAAAAPEPLEPLRSLAFELVADGLREPVDVVALPADPALPGAGGLLVAERTGLLRLLEPDGGTAAREEPYLDLTGVANVNSIEQGLLGIALHPRFPRDPRAFLYHSLASNDNVLVSYRLDARGDRLDPATRTELLTIDKEPDKVRHNGGGLLFGPDGYLYLSVGDAARASVNGQDPHTLPGTVLRIDVDRGDPYAIPPGNPFADGRGGAPEVWWFGLRNPWRWWIDVPTGLAYIADVGQDDVEEVNVVPYTDAGHNFGWPVFEGTRTFYGGEPASPVTDPVLEVLHDDTDLACSITGGVVYRGAAIPELDGHYLYADWCRGWIRSFRYDSGEVADHVDRSGELPAQRVSAFGVDGDGEVLVLDHGTGEVLRIVAVR